MTAAAAAAVAGVQGHEEEEDDSLESYRAALPPPLLLGRPRPRHQQQRGGTCERLTLAIQHKAGQLAETLQWEGEVVGPLQDEGARAKVQQAAGELAAALLRLAEHLCIDPGRAMLEKWPLTLGAYGERRGNKEEEGKSRKRRREGREKKRGEVRLFDQSR